MAEPIADMNRALLNLEPKEFTVEPSTLQSLQQLIQWVADLALNLLARLPEHRQPRGPGVSVTNVYPGEVDVIVGAHSMSCCEIWRPWTRCENCWWSFASGVWCDSRVCQPSCSLQITSMSCRCASSFSRAWCRIPNLMKHLLVSNISHYRALLYILGYFLFHFVDVWPQLLLIILSNGKILIFKINKVPTSMYNKTVSN